MKQRKIPYALYHKNWKGDDDTLSLLNSEPQKITPPDYKSTMHGKIFCPSCFVPLIRNPKSKAKFSNDRDAFFAHKGNFKDVKCDLRALRTEGRMYINEEIAKKAIENEELVIIEGFMSQKYEPEDAEVKPYDETAVEEVGGKISEVAIGRHVGDTFKLPSKVTTVAGICRNFDINFNKYFVFPETDHAVLLKKALKNIKEVSESNERPKLYYGKIKGFDHRGKNKLPSNIRFTYLENHNSIWDFCLKMTDKAQRERGVDDQCDGKYLIAYGKIYINGSGLCFENLNWGEFYLLPQKYNELLESL